MIELFGVPGCGKTTYTYNYYMKQGYINILEKYLYDASRVKQNFNKIKLVIYFCYTDSSTFVKTFRQFNTIKFKSKTKKIKMFLYLYSVLGAINKGKKIKKIFIVDEGVNQIMWGFLYNSSESTESILKLNSSLYAYWGDEIIYFDTDKKTIRERLLNRSGKGGSELQHDIHYNESKLDEAFEYVSIIMGYLYKTGKADCLKHAKD